MPEVAIVGVSGLIGAALAARLVERGDGVTGIVRTDRPVVAGRRQVVWDPSRGPAPEGLFAGCDTVVNLAGAPIAQRWTASAWDAIVSSRVTATEHVVEAVRRDGVRTLLNASAVGYYGSTDDPVDENSPAGSGPLAELCVRWERAAAAAADVARVVSLRAGIVLSGAGGALPRLLTPAKLGLGGPIGGGRQWFPWIHIDDVIELIGWAIDGSHAGPINLVAPGIVRQREFAETLGAVLGRPALVPTPAFALRLALGDGATVVTEGQNVVPAVAGAAGYAYRHPELEPALRSLLG